MTNYRTLQIVRRIKSFGGARLSLTGFEKPSSKVALIYLNSKNNGHDRIAADRANYLVKHYAEHALSMEVEMFGGRNTYHFSNKR